MFPTTVWDLVRDAGASDPAALERFARDYRASVLETIRRRGASANDAEDLCQEVFVKLLQGGVLAKADPERGSFRSLLKTVTVRVVIDWWRKKKELPREEAEPAAPEPDFDREWAVHLTERALAKLKVESPGYHEVLQDHLEGREVSRNRLWIARGKLSTLLRREIALTCRGPEEIEEEYLVLAPYLQPASKA